MMAMFKRMVALFAARAGTADRADALSGGQQVGSANQPVYFGADGKPVAGNQIPTVKDTNVVLIPPRWNGDAPPFTQQKIVSGMTADKKIFVMFDTLNMTSIQRREMRNAHIYCTEQGTDTLTFVADGIAPSQSIPLIIREIG